jgi:diguanylate cyclase (GGDEF)-like protein/PAS domain S-box-containing protein
MTERRKSRILQPPPKPKAKAAAGPRKQGDKARPRPAPAQARAAKTNQRDGAAPLQQILRSTADGVLAVGTEGKVLYANERFAEMWRIPQGVMASQDDAVLLQHVLDQLSDPPAFLEQVQALYKSWDESLDTLLFKDGRVFERRSRPLVEGTELRGRVWSFHDVTARKQADKLQEATYRIAQAADRAENLESLFPAIHAIIQEVMVADNFYIALHDKESDLLSFPYYVDEVDSPVPPQKPGKGLTEFVLRSGRSLLCDEALFDKLVERGEVESVGAASPIWLGVPLIVEGQPIGIIALQDYRNPNAYRERERHMLEYVSSQAAMAIHRKWTEEALRQAEAKYRALTEQIPAVIYTDEYATGRTLYISPYVKTMLGYSPEAWKADPELCTDIMHPEDRDWVFEKMANAEPPKPLTLDYRYIAKDGHVVWVRDQAFLVNDRSGQPAYWQGIILDITAQKVAEDALRRAEEKYRNLFEKAVEGIFQSTTDGQLITANPALARMLGYDSPEEFMARVNGPDVALYVNPGRWEMYRRELAENGKVTNFESEVYRKDGARIWISENVQVVAEAAGEVHHEGTLVEITARKQAEQDLHRAKAALETVNRELQRSLTREEALARTDGLTGLPNRLHFEERAAREFQAAAGSGGTLSIMMFDTDDLKQINDTLGHEAGDQALVRIAQIAGEHTRGSDFLARLGGDEFIVLLPQTTAGQALPIAERIRTHAASVRIGEPDVARAISLSAGIAELRREPMDESFQQIVQRADQALYRAKAAGRDRVCVDGT